MEFVGFDWDEGNKHKCLEHGVSRSEIEGIFNASTTFATDPRHSLIERRYRAVGGTSGNRRIFVVFTLRTWLGETLVRPISARYMHLKEIAAYEQAISGLQKR